MAGSERPGTEDPLAKHLQDGAYQFEGVLVLPGELVVAGQPVAWVRLALEPTGAAK